MGFLARIPRLWARVPLLWLYIVLDLASLVFSILGVLLAIYKHCPSLGGLGGALGTAFAFVALFLRPDYGLRLYEILLKGIPPDLPKLEQLEAKLNAVEEALRVNSNGLTFQNGAIAIASVIGTLFWAFGEYLARGLMCIFHISISTSCQ